jgi:NAD+ synthase (glutamine-hydrolysing)
VRIGLGQINTTVGDLAGNAERILRFASQAAAAGCELFVTPELALCGYPPQDLLFKRHFISDQLDMLHQRLAPAVPLPTLLGFVDRDLAGHLYNAAGLLFGGQLRQTVHKTLLPTYDVFDEQRYFTPAADNRPLELAGRRLGVTICEDIWDGPYHHKVVPQLAAHGAEVILNLSSSPFHAGKRRERIELLRRHSLSCGLPLLYCNGVGAQDELIFDGESIGMDGRGRLVALGPQFAERLVLVDCCTLRAPDATGAAAVIVAEDQPEREVFEALCLGVADYFRKCGFSRAVIGLSGGVDSALTACIAVEALGGNQVIGVAMPSRYSALESTRDAQQLAASLGIEFHAVPIEDSILVAKQRFMAHFGEYQHGVTAENLQARERGKLLMEVSNDRGALVLATGNKTEYALGYSTLYGDMCGGLAVIGDLSKPEVYALSRYYNARRGREIIPKYTLNRPPSAELRADQVDPFDYDRISPLVDLIVEDHLSRNDLLARSYHAEEIDLCFRLVRNNEYKRQQAPPILRVSRKAFGIGRRMPIANIYPW